MVLFWSCSSTRLTTCTTSSARWREPGWMSMIHCEPPQKECIHILTIFSSIPRPDEFGTSLSPNTATSLSVQVIFIYTFEFNSLTRWTRSREWKLLSRANVWIVGIWLDTTYQMLTPFRLFVYKQATNIPIYFLSSARHFVTARPLLQIAAAIGQNSSFRKR